MKILTQNNLLEKVRTKITTQTYSQKPLIKDVQVIEIKHLTSEDGTFEEIFRLDKKGKIKILPNFTLRQVSCSQLLPGAIKAWHIHFNQEDVWYIPYTDHMLLGLWDLRKNSPTKDLKLRIVMGAGISKLVYIPRGVAHGISNLANKTGTIFYFVNQEFDFKNSDEHRLPWNIAGVDFWQSKKE